MSNLSATGLKGTYSEANVAGVATQMKASVTGSLNYQVGGAYTTTTADQTLTLNGTDIALANGTDIDGAVAAINAKTSDTGVTAVKDSNGDLQLTSKKAFTASASAAGVIAGISGTEVTAAKNAKLNNDAEISINGVSIALAAQDPLGGATSVVSKINAQTANTGVSASLTSDGRLQLDSVDGTGKATGKAITLADGAGTDGPGTLAALGLSGGTTETKLTANTSLNINGVEVKFNQGSTMDEIISSINSASTGVTASKVTTAGADKISCSLTRTSRSLKAAPVPA